MNTTFPSTAIEASKTLLERHSAVGFTTAGRKKKITVLYINTANPVKLVTWKHKTFIVPSYLVGSTFCLKTAWIFEVCLKDGKEVFYRFTDRRTRVTGGWKRTPSGALKAAYFAATGKKMKDSHNGRAEVGIFTKAMRAFIAAACTHLLPQHLREYQNEVLTLHRNVDRELMDDPLVIKARQTTQPPVVEQQDQEDESEEEQEEYEDEDDALSIGSFDLLGDDEDALMDGMEEYFRTAFDEEDQAPSKRARMEEEIVVHEDGLCPLSQDFPFGHNDTS